MIGKSVRAAEMVAGPMLALYMALLQVWVSLQRACDWIHVNSSTSGGRCVLVASAMTVGAVAPVARPKCCTSTRSSISRSSTGLYDTHGVAPGYNYKKVASWMSRKYQGTLRCLLSDRYSASGIADIDKLVMPVFASGNH